MVYQDRIETNISQLFAYPENSEWFSIISVIIFEVNIVAEQKHYRFFVFVSFHYPQLFYCPHPYRCSGVSDLLCDERQEHGDSTFREGGVEWFKMTGCVCVTEEYQLPQTKCSKWSSNRSHVAGGNRLTNSDQMRPRITQDSTSHRKTYAAFSSRTHEYRCVERPPLFWSAKILSKGLSTITPRKNLRKAKAVIGWTTWVGYSFACATLNKTPVLWLARRAKTIQIEVWNSPWGLRLRECLGTSATEGHAGTWRCNGDRTCARKTDHNRTTPKKPQLCR